METLSKLNIHMIQYSFIGLALALFYLLLTALSEHLGFRSAYVIATLLVVSTVSGYAKTVFKKFRHALMVGCTTSLLYVYLYFLLQEAKYSFLIGALSVFGVLIAAMYLTRKVDWHQLSKKVSQPKQQLPVQDGE
jgi:inner membrane protein